MDRLEKELAALGISYDFWSPGMDDIIDAEDRYDATWEITADIERDTDRNWLYGAEDSAYDDIPF